MTDITVYSQGYEAGRENQDSRSNPYESTEDILDWLEGYREGQKVYERYREQT